MNPTILPTALSAGGGLELREATLQAEDLACLTEKFGSDEMHAIVDDPEAITAAGAAQFSYEAVLNARHSSRSPAPVVLMLMICDSELQRLYPDGVTPEGQRVVTIARAA